MLRLDLGEEVTTLHDLQANILARHKALYKGHAIAAVAATNPHMAEEAVKLIDVEYEVLPSIMTAPQGMAADAPILHESMKTDELGETIEDKPSNVAQHFQHVKGDVEKGFADADVVVEREVRHGNGAPGLYRAPRSKRDLEHGRQAAYMVQHAGCVHRARRHRRGATPACVSGARYADGDRWRLRWQDSSLS